MSLYQSSNETPGICMRCHMRKRRKDLRGDPNSPGLLVCKDCVDELDPYRKAQRQPENIIVKRPSVDEKLDA